VYVCVIYVRYVCDMCLCLETLCAVEELLEMRCACACVCGMYVCDLCVSFCVIVSVLLFVVFCAVCL